MDKKVALITGSSRGIGKAIALRLSNNGAGVIVTGRSEEGVNKAVSEIQSKTGGEVFGYALDVSDFSACSSVIKSIYEKHERLDYLVNNAGITRDTLFLRMKEDDWDDVIDINLKGIFNCSKAVIRNMMKKKSGKIVNITSLVGVAGNAGQVNYASAKAGVIGFTKSLAREYASKGITVNAVAPGYIETDMTSELSQSVIDTVKKEIPVGRFGSVEDIAASVSFLLSNEANYITGQVIHVNGGLLMP